MDFIYSCCGKALRDPKALSSEKIRKVKKEKKQ